MKNSIFRNFQPLEITDSSTIYGGVANDTGTTSYIEITHGPTGLDNYPDAENNDGSRGDWDDKDACKDVCSG